MAEFINQATINLNATDQAIAGSAQAILTATDREIIKKRVGNLDTTKNFTELIKDMLEKPMVIDKVETGEKEKLEQENFETRLKIEKKLIKSTKPEGYTPEKEDKGSKEEKSKKETTTENMPVAYQDKFESNIEPPLNEYAVLYGQKLLNIPIDNEFFNQIKEKIDPKLLGYIQEIVKKSLPELLNILTKDALSERIQTPESASNIIIRAKTPQKLLDHYLGLIKLDLNELISLTKSLKIPIEKIKLLYNMETVSLSFESLKIKEVEERRKSEIARLKELLINQTVQMLLTDAPLERYMLLIETNLIKASGTSLHLLDEKTIDSIIYEAKKIAWLKSVALLKELHLKRVFSNSKKEFEHLSRSIEDHTVRARKLGLRVSREGIKWIEAKIETMALQAAKYKSQLLKSMQTLSSNKEQDKYIEWLDTIISHLQKTISKKNT